MAKKPRVTRKKLLKEPDEFITTTGRMIRWAQQYQKTLTAAAIVFFVVLITIAGFRYLANQSENKAFRLLSEAVVKHEQLMNSMDPDKAYQATKADFEYIIRKYKKKRGATMARVIFADASLAAGDTDRAIALYEQALKDLGHEASLRNFILSSLGYAYEKKQAYQQAVFYFKTIAEGEDPVMKDIALFNLGRLYEVLGEPVQSKEAFNRLVSDHKDSMYFELAKEKLAG